jgi:hypothetical protein
MDGVDKTFFEQFLYFNLNNFYFLRINWTRLLSNRLSVRISHDFLFDDSWINAWHFLVRLGKNFEEFFKQIHVDLNFLRRTIHSDENILCDARGSGDINRYHFSDGFHITLSVNNMCI